MKISNRREEIKINGYFFQKYVKQDITNRKKIIFKYFSIIKVNFEEKVERLNEKKKKKLRILKKKNK